MFFIDTSRDGKPVYNAIVNQSLDNYLVNDLKLAGHGLIMYINNPSVIVGVNQNAYAEVNFPYLKENNLQLVRRTSGGGAVYHDYGNLILKTLSSVTMIILEIMVTLLNLSSMPYKIWVQMLNCVVEMISLLTARSSLV
jgi:Lipoate-protein ligase A